MTWEQLIDKIRQTADDYPTRVAPPMWAYFNGEPCCLVATALHRLGANASTINMNAIGYGARHALEAQGLTDFMGAESRWVHAVLKNQDAGMPWLSAVQVADITFARAQEPVAA